MEICSIENGITTIQCDKITGKNSTDIKLMVGGIGFSIFAALAHKVLTFIKELGELNKHEIGN